jgi:transcriptional regulator GlxA family with amidase domain
MRDSIRSPRRVRTVPLIVFLIVIVSIALLVTMLRASARKAAVTGAARAAATGAVVAAAASSRAAAAWVCPMNDGGTSDQPGTCPRCGMALVSAVSVPPPLPPDASPPRVAAYVCSKGDGTEGVEAGRCAKCGAPMVSVSRDLTAGILIFDGVQIIDFCGPFEVFGQARCRTLTIAKTAGPVTTAMGMKVTPSFSFADCPPLDVLIIPGGTVDSVEGDAAAIAWLRERGDRAQFVLSVCNGAFILARTGLLDGKTATTFYDLIDEFATRYPKVEAVTNRRYVDNGKVVTTAGISSGIDGSLHVIEKLRGHGMAQRVALNMEYDWKPTADYARASFADKPLRRIFERNLRLRIIDGVAPLLVHTRGTQDRWEVEWRLKSRDRVSELLARLDRTVEERGPWSRVSAAGGPRAGRGIAGGPERGAAAGAARSRWRFDREGTAWSGVTEVEPEPRSGHYRVRVRVEKGS